MTDDRELQTQGSKYQYVNAGRGQEAGGSEEAENKDPPKREKPPVLRQ